MSACSTAGSEGKCHSPVPPASPGLCRASAHPALSAMLPWLTTLGHRSLFPGLSMARRTFRTALTCSALITPGPCLLLSSSPSRNLIPLPGVGPAPNRSVSLCRPTFHRQSRVFSLSAFPPSRTHLSLASSMASYTLLLASSSTFQVTPVSPSHSTPMSCICASILSVGLLVRKPLVCGIRPPSCIPRYRFTKPLHITPRSSSELFSTCIFSIIATAYVNSSGSTPTPISRRSLPSVRLDVFLLRPTTLFAATPNLWFRR